MARHSELDFELIDAVEDFDRPAIDRALRRGANVNAKRSDGYTALHIAAFSSRRSIVEKLILNRADFEIRDASGKTALFHAVSCRDFKCVKHLVEDGGADVNARDNDGDTVLHQLTDFEQEEFEYIIENGGDPNIANNKGHTALHVAVDNGYISDVVNLVNAGVDIALKDVKGKTPLMIAMENKQEDIVDYLKSLSEQMSLDNEIHSTSEAAQLLF